MKWTSETTKLGADVRRVQVFSDGTCLSHREVHKLWEKDPEFADFYSRTILGSGFPGLCWETPPVTRSNLDDDHEFVLVNSPLLLSRAANSLPFQEHFLSVKENVVSFPNLGRNGIMITPVPAESRSTYGHLADFLKEAPLDGISELWRVTACEARKNLADKPIWLSTAGLGVAWLHVRIDSRPKYYRYEPYRAFYAE